MSDAFQTGGCYEIISRPLQRVMRENYKKKKFIDIPLKRASIIYSPICHLYISNFCIHLNGFQIEGYMLRKKHRHYMLHVPITY